MVRGAVVLGKMDLDKAASGVIPTSVVTATSASTITAFPLATALELPTSATGNDLVVVVTGRLQELGRNPASGH